MAQLRQGIRLKKVDYSRTPAEYELTPYEVGRQRSCNFIIRLSQMLMDDVRTRKYRLSPVSVAPQSAQARKDARDIILEFIRYIGLKSINTYSVLPNPGLVLLSNLRRIESLHRRRRR